MNLIRPQAVTNLPVQGEVSPHRRLAVKEHEPAGPACALVSSACAGRLGVVEDGMVGKRREISRESPVGPDLEFMAREGPKSQGHRAVRAFVVAWKRGNARGAKERRKMDAR